MNLPLKADNIFAALKVFKADKLESLGPAFATFYNTKIPFALEHQMNIIDVYSCSFNMKIAFLENPRETLILQEGVTKVTYEDIYLKINVH